MGGSNAVTTFGPTLKIFALGGLGLMLSACAAPAPTGSGVGFGDYQQYEMERAQREAQLTGSATVSLPPPSGIATSDLNSAGIGAGQSTMATASMGADLDRRGGVQASPTNAAPQIAGNGSTGISDEQSFEAVANRETIQSDAERRAQQAAAYQVVQPTALPQRDGETGPNIVEYALNAPNKRGQEWYSRFILGGVGGRFERNCASYRSPDAAQRDFLARGGPERDPRGIDPDGDGFACGWDPAPFLAAVDR